MFERFTDRARKVMGFARQEAQRLGHECIGTEHMTLGLALEPVGVAAVALQNLGVDMGRVRAEVDLLVTPGGARPMGQIPFTPRAKRALTRAVAEADKGADNHVGTEHLLLGVLGEDGTGARALKCAGADPEAVRAEVSNLREASAAADATDAPRAPMSWAGFETPPVLVTESAEAVQKAGGPVEVTDRTTDADRAAGRMRVGLKLNLPEQMREMLGRQIADLRARGAELEPACRACDEEWKVQVWRAGDVGPGGMSTLSFVRRPCPECQPEADEPARRAHFRYRNHKGEVAVRRAVPGAIYWGRTEWHPEDQWILRAWDLDRGATRDYAMRDVVTWTDQGCPDCGGLGDAQPRPSGAGQTAQCGRCRGTGRVPLEAPER